MSSKPKQYWDALERTVWTGLEGAGAVGIVAVLKQYIELDQKWWALIAVVIGVLLAAGKGIIVTNYGNGSASTLPADKEPIPAEAIQGELAPGVGRELRDADGDGRDDENGQFVKR